MSLNMNAKEKYTELHVQLNLIRPKSILVEMKKKNGVDIHLQSIPRSVLSDKTDRGFGNIMMMPTDRDIEVATWFWMKEIMPHVGAK